MRYIRNLRFPLWFALLSLLSLGFVACGDADDDGSGGAGGQAAGGNGGTDDPGSGGEGGSDDPGSGGNGGEGGGSGEGGTGGEDPGVGGSGGGDPVTCDTEAGETLCKAGDFSYCADLTSDLHNCGECGYDCRALGQNFMCIDSLCQ